MEIKMDSIIRPMTPEDKDSVLEMMRVFYASPAVFTNGSDEIFQNDIENCINDNPYLEGYVFESSGEIQGYGMIAKSFSTEFGRPCMWIEDIYVKSSCRGSGIGSRFIHYIGEKYQGNQRLWEKWIFLFTLYGNEKITHRGWNTGSPMLSPSHFQ